MVEQSGSDAYDFSTDAGVPNLTPLETMRHSAAHVMAHAVQRLFPGARVTIGPAIETGFYYDFAVDTPFTEEDLPKIEAEMARIAAGRHPFRREEVSREEALALFSSMGEHYKVELLQAIPPGQTITLYRHDDFVDLCRGPHVEHTGCIGAFKLLSVAGAYWRGDSRNPMLSRIYGTTFPTKEELDAYLRQLEEARRRDHRKLGRELELIHFEPLAPGCAFWLPRGAVLWNTLSQWMRGLLLSHGYVEVRTPLIFNKRLWEISGHWEHYQDNMFVMEAEGQVYGLKPMNCPSHMLLFGARRRSYRELPLRMHDQGVLHRAEPSGTLGGLTRVRQFVQDDAHLFVTPDQVAAEMDQLLGLVDRVYRTFDLRYQVKLSTRDPAKMMGDPALWDRAEADLRSTLAARGMSYIEQAREAAFYGPKIDFDVTDAIGRKWQCATIQLDFQIPLRFDLTYVGEDNAEHRPVVIHRAIFGSFERFIALLIEHYAGAFPLWLSPVQARVLGVSQRHDAYVREANELLLRHGVRSEVDLSGDKLGAKIRRAQLDKVPYMVVIGDKEVAARTVSPRTRDGRQLEARPLEVFARELAAEAQPPPVAD
ncbi:MAG: threonine--tRNA ligase [Myxococcales bacterium]|nr:threonine--tRNA ligase [Myxococcota bacterium]MDW8282036.1 threonine--tRNA ligase [Myxococcales bacterium]